MSGQRRTSKTTILLRFYMLSTTIAVLLYLLPIVVGIGKSWPFMPLMIGCFVGINLYVLFHWSIIRFMGWVMSGDDPSYQRYIANGGDPYFDGLPMPFNFDSGTQRIGGRSEPYYDRSFVPPEFWRFQCPRCGARVEHGNDMCWNCGHGNDLRQCHGCGTIVREPSFGAFETTGVLCSNCGTLIQA